MATVKANAVVSVQAVSLAPQNVKQGDTGIPYMKMTLNSDSSSLQWNSLRILRTGAGNDNDIKNIKIYLDSDYNGSYDMLRDQLISSGSDLFSGGVSTVVFTQSRYITNTPQTYFVALDIANTAIASGYVGVKIDTTTCFGEPLSAAIKEKWVSPDSVEHYYPIESGLSLINPIRLHLSVNGNIPSKVMQGAVNLQAMSYTLSTDSNSVRWNNLKITQTGTAPDGSVTKISLYEDTNSNLLMEPGAPDRLIGSADYGAGSSFYNREARLDLIQQNITISTKPVNYFAALNIFTDAVVNETVGLKIIANIGLLSQPTLYFDIAPQSAVFEAESSGIEFSTGLAIIMDKRMPTKPVVKTAPWTNESTKLKAKFTSSAVSGIAEYQYSVGTTPEQDNVSGGWRIIPPSRETETEETAGSLILEHDTTYYFNVRAKSNAQLTSEIGYAASRIDLTPPTRPRSVPVYKGGEPKTGTFVISWGLSQDPESGILGYQIQEREDTSPVWSNVDDTELLLSTAVTSYTIGSQKKKDIGCFYFYRVRAKNTAGSFGEFSEAVDPIMTGAPEQAVSQVSSYPNPFSPGKKNASISFLSNQYTKAGVKIYDSNGELVRDFGSLSVNIGSNKIAWNGKNDRGETVNSGGYICHISVESDKGIIEKKLKIMVVR